MASPPDAALPIHMIGKSESLCLTRLGW